MQQGTSGSVMLGNDADEQSLLIIRYEDPDTGKLKFKIGVSGRACDVVDVQDGLAENTPYRLNDDFDFVPA